MPLSMRLSKHTERRRACAVRPVSQLNLPHDDTTAVVEIASKHKFTWIITVGSSDCDPSLRFVDTWVVKKVITCENEKKSFQSPWSL